MIQNARPPSGPYLHAPTLSLSLPLCSAVTPQEIESIFRYVYEGTIDKEYLSHRSERWIIAAYKELREAELLAYRWFKMKLVELYAADLHELTDFSLLTYASVVEERDVEMASPGEGTTGWERVVLAHEMITQREDGTDLVNYNWFYRDMHQYHMVPDEDAYLRVAEHMVKFDLTYCPTDTSNDQIVDSLSLLACDWLDFKRETEAVALLTRLFATQPIPFFVYERVAAILTKLEYRPLLSLFIQGMQQAAAQSTHAAEALTKIRSMIAFAPPTISPRNTMERRFLHAVRRIHNEPTEPIEYLAYEAIPHLPTVPVKRIPKL